MSEPTPNLPALAPRAELPAVAPRALIDAVLAGRKATTLRSYAADYRDFARAIGVASPAAALDALVSASQGQAHALAIAYRASMTDRGLSSATIARRLAALRTAVAVARAIGRVDWHLSIEGPTVESLRDVRGPGDAGWRAMLELAKGDAATGGAKAARDLALIHLLRNMALRRNEAVTLDLSDYDRAAGTLAVLGKGRTSRVTLTIPGPTRKALDAWIATRGAAAGPLFIRLDRAKGATPERITGEAVRLIVRALGKRAGLTRPVKPHGLRHAGITAALDATGGDVRKVQRFSRHRSMDLVMRYDDARRDDAGAIASMIAED
jgi:integrase/recombinase XerC